MWTMTESSYSLVLQPPLFFALEKSWWWTLCLYCLLLSQVAPSSNPLLDNEQKWIAYRLDVGKWIFLRRSWATTSSYDLNNQKAYIFRKMFCFEQSYFWVVVFLAEEQKARPEQTHLTAEAPKIFHKAKLPSYLLFLGLFILRMSLRLNGQLLMMSYSWVAS